MRYLFTLFFVLTLYSCSTKTKWTLDSKKPIVDYSTDYEANKRMLMLSAAIEKQNAQTVVLINNKTSDLKKFNKLLKEDKIKEFKVFKEKEEVEQFNYDYNQVRTILVATRK
ncbi:hypothetical protein [Chryseobacterium gossypii]|uniref:hypothetical protein n=1 Tax=Chryseobacterium gossypii TaxID=3231602 RepID=UPI0035241D3F